MKIKKPIASAFDFLITLHYSQIIYRYRSMLHELGAKKFSGVCIDLIVQDFRVSVHHHSITDRDYSKLLVNFLAGRELKLHLMKIDPKAPHLIVVDKLR